ncbi:hypothetical protein MSAN_00156300 [Mycena sanguinolenta]|uniref:Uncharacterized protein n=1 Tax=Mycena sanguinolenta TaxID=230812 RepID=A0A8H7DM26_9AGAR|nr:hypothetical protein MSAN_00156300 [Mycena sanguinolenta]
MMALSRFHTLLSKKGTRLLHPGATASLRSNPESEPRDIETNTDPLTDSNTARTDYSDTVESMSGGQTINLTVHAMSLLQIPIELT